MKRHSPDTTMEEIAQAWLTVQRSRVRASTNAIYHYGWQHYLSPIFGQLQPKRVTEHLIRKYLQAKQNLSTLTLRNQIILLRVILKFAQEKYGINNDYQAICLPEAYGERLFIANTTWLRLQRLIREDDTLIADCIALASLTGIRLGECCALRCMDIKVLSELLGHSSVSVTLNYYVHPDLAYKRRQINKFANAY